MKVMLDTDSCIYLINRRNTREFSHVPGLTINTWLND